MRLEKAKTDCAEGNFCLIDMIRQFTMVCRVISSIWFWLQHYYRDFSNKPTCISTLNDFIQNTLRKQNETVYEQQLEKIIAEKKPPSVRNDIVMY
jgi:hypothetical protein